MTTVNSNGCNLQKLRDKWPYPASKFDVPQDYTGNKPTGWCHPSCDENLKSLLNADTKLVVDGGSWKGRSAYVMATYAHNATVICIDTWKGSIEHQEKFKESLAILYETFCVNLWNKRDRIIPIKMNSVEGMKEIHTHNVVPDLIYVDWAHDADSVEQDVLTALSLFPDSIICGDDYNWRSVQAGLARVCVKTNRKLLLTDRVFWRIQ